MFRTFVMSVQGVCLGDKGQLGNVRTAGFLHGMVAWRRCTRQCNQAAETGTKLLAVHGRRTDT
jgi:hypothetical protein